MSTRGMSSGLIKDAAPDLVLGLFGVPVAFAVQNIAQETVRQKMGVLEGISYILLFMTLYAVYAISLLVLLEQACGWAIYIVSILLGVIATVAVIMAGAYYPDVGKTQLASIIGVLTPMLTFGFVLLYQPRLSQGRQSMISVLLGLYGVLVFLLSLIIYM